MLVAILQNNDDSSMAEIIQKVLASKNLENLQELTGIYWRMDNGSITARVPLWYFAANDGHLDIIEYCWNWSENRNFRIEKYIDQRDLWTYKG